MRKESDLQFFKWNIFSNAKSSLLCESENEEFDDVPFNDIHIYTRGRNERNSSDTACFRLRFTCITNVHVHTRMHITGIMKRCNLFHTTRKYPEKLLFDKYFSGIYLKYDITVCTNCKRFFLFLSFSFFNIVVFKLRMYSRIKMAKMTTRGGKPVFAQRRKK